MFGYCYDVIESKGQKGRLRPHKGQQTVTCPRAIFYQNGSNIFFFRIAKIKNVIFWQFALWHDTIHNNKILENATKWVLNKKRGCTNQQNYRGRFGRKYQNASTYLLTGFYLKFWPLTPINREHFDQIIICETEQTPWKLWNCGSWKLVASSASSSSNFPTEFTFPTCLGCSRPPLFTSNYCDSVTSIVCVIVYPNQTVFLAQKRFQSVSIVISTGFQIDDIYYSMSPRIQIRVWAKKLRLQVMTDYTVTLKSHSRCTRFRVWEKKN